MSIVPFCVVLSGLLAADSAAADVRIVWIKNVHLGDELRTQPFGHRGVPEQPVWFEINRLFRSHRTGGVRVINPALLRALAQIQRHFGGRRIELLSGYRVPTPGARLNSYHQVGRAADIFIEGVADRALFDYCRKMPRLGCGLYPAGFHVHVDVRSVATIWVDLSRYGEPADYVAAPGPWIAAHPEAAASSHAGPVASYRSYRHPLVSNGLSPLRTALAQTARGHN